MRYDVREQTDASDQIPAPKASEVIHRESYRRVPVRRLQQIHLIS